MTLKKIASILLWIGFCSIINGQIKVSNDVNDTLSVEKAGKKIEFENDINLWKKWNDELFKIVKKRYQIKGLDPKIKLFYQNSYIASLLTEAYYKEITGDLKGNIDINIQVLKTCDPKIHQKMLGYVHGSIAISYIKENEFEQAEKNIKKSIYYSKAVADYNQLGQVYSTYASLKNRQKKYKESIKLNLISLAYKKKIGNSSEIGLTYNNLGSNYNQIDNYQKALFYYQKAIEELTISKNFNTLSTTYYNIYVLKDQRGYKTEAIDYLKKAFETAVECRELEMIKKSGEDLHDYYKKNNDPIKALYVLEKVVEANAILSKEENKNAMLKADFKYQTEKKEAAIETLYQKNKIAELETKRKSVTLYLLLILFVTMTGTAYVLFARFKVKKKNELLQSQLEEAEKLLEAEKKVTESELKALKSQMNPHFIFNALNSIQMQFMYGDKFVANEQLNNFTYLTRQILEVSGKKQITIAEETEILTKYLELEQLRFSKDFTYQITISDKIDEDYHKIPPMLIQPIVENSLKHGLMHQKGPKRIEIVFEIDKEETFISCTVTDNGIGREKSAEIKAKNQSGHTSFSTASILQRLELLNTKLHLQNLLQYEDIANEKNEVDGTRAVIKIPLYS